jgi:hypothetical protein
MNEKPKTGCPEYVWGDRGWSHHRCGREIKRGRFCGIHAAAIERRQKNAWEREEKRERLNRIWLSYKAKVAELLPFFGEGDVRAASGLPGSDCPASSFVEIRIDVLKRLMLNSGYKVLVPDDQS